MTDLTLGRAKYSPLDVFQRAQHRLHLNATEHAPLIIFATFIVTTLSRLWLESPALTSAAVLMLAAVLWRAGLPQSERSSARTMFVLAVALFLVTSISCAPDAHATLGDMVMSVVSDGQKWMTGVSYGCYGAGFVSTAVGVNNGIKKSKGDQQVTGGHVWGPGLGGPALGMIGYVMNQGAATEGGGAATMNQLPSAAQ